jgi:hypothetical protein
MDSKPPEVLILRAWLERTARRRRLRIRIVAIRPGQSEQQVLSSTSVQKACDAVRDWLSNIEMPDLDLQGDAAVTRRRRWRAK